MTGWVSQEGGRGEWVKMVIMRWHRTGRAMWWAISSDPFTPNLDRPSFLSQYCQKTFESIVVQEGRPTIYIYIIQATINQMEKHHIVDPNPGAGAFGTGRDP